MGCILVYEKERIKEISNRNVEIDELFRFFFEFPERTVYVIDNEQYDNDKVIGIITQGDFKRYLDGRKSILYNRKFTTCDIDSTDAINKIFEEKRKIASIPVINAYGEIVKEYYRGSEKKKGSEYFSLVEKIYQEAYMSSYDVNIFVLDDLSEEQKGRAEQIKRDTNGKVILTDNLMTVFSDVVEKNMDLGSIWVYILFSDKIALGDLFCKQKNINHICLDKDRMDSIASINYLAGFFTGVGYLDINFDIDEKIQADSCCKKYGLKDFVWDENLVCYRCIVDDSEKIEVLFTYLKLSKDKFYVVMGDRYIPVISLFCDYVRVPNKGRQISDEDIAFNIIPKLQNNGVKCIVIEDPQRKYDSLPESEKFFYCKKEEGIFDREVGGREHEAFWTENGEYEEGFLKERRLWSVFQKKGILKVGNIYGEYINYFNGERYTCGNPQKYDNTIFLFGPCHVWGSVLSDSQTLGSYLRERISDKYYIKNCGSLWESINIVLREQKYRHGDIVVVFASRSESYNLQRIPLYSIWEAYQKLPDPQCNLWDSLYHGNHIVSACIADVLQKIINENISSCSDISSMYDMKVKQNLSISFGRHSVESMVLPDGLKDWLKNVRKYKVPCKKKAGAIVMNCNPFTLGHRYLVEEAKKQVEVLYVFVVEENKSFFDFQDRLNMVRLGVIDMDNVIIIPSGEYIISSSTLPGYFEKEEKSDAKFDATDDLKIFGEIIAKEFDIQIRFAGEEPSDQFTNRYNEFMRTLLPKYGVEFCEIPRKQWKGEVISASRIRDYIKNKKYELIKDLTMPSIYKYLEEHHLL